ncbi:WD40 repeat-like protein [Microthyrium microscopicum]|uniref:WD40 repeat-like protein n=1 Tax=Microthyrium microscopicum TaxID=703497 RepID=A0A6A6UA29_9PEZI|nr:WD40 repeat-like protein [Microthyrium microscopicum]
MNLSLVEPEYLAKDLPEALQDCLKSGFSTCIRFNHRGDFLASGRGDGNVIIFDCDTNGIARKLSGHFAHVQSLCWSADDRYLLTASQDWSVVLWDLSTGERMRRVRFEAPIFLAELHPTNHLLFVCAQFDEQPMLVDVQEPEAVKRVLPTIPKRSEDEIANATEKQAAQDAKQNTTATIFSPTGDFIFSCTNKGWFNIIDTATCQTLSSTKITSSMITLMRLTANGKSMVINSGDRIIRTFELPDMTAPDFNFDNFQLEVRQKYQDVINKLSWHWVCWNPSGEHILASTMMHHNIYCWAEHLEGSLVKILEAPDEITSFDFHPYKPRVAAIGQDDGQIYLWGVPAPQSWAALAPDFVEVEENVEHAEREDEFDIQPAEELQRRRLDLEDEEIDVLTMDPVKDSQFQPGAFVMPVSMDVISDVEDEVVAIGAGQFRRKTPGQDWLTVETEPALSGDESKKASNGTRSAGNGGTKRKQRTD